MFRGDLTKLTITNAGKFDGLFKLDYACTVDEKFCQNPTLFDKL